MVRSEARDVGGGQVERDFIVWMTEIHRGSLNKKSLKCEGHRLKSQRDSG